MRHASNVMRIVHIYKDYFPVLGGIENHIRHLAEAQAQAGHDVTVLVTQLAGKPGADEHVRGVHVVKTQRQMNVQSAPISVQFGKQVNVQTAGADIAHLHAPYPIGEACNLYFGRARKTVISWHSDIVRQKTLLRMYAPVLRRVVAKADLIIPASAQYARSSPWLSHAQDKCHIVPYGIDVSAFVTDPMTGGFVRNRLLAGINVAQPLVLLSVGRLRYYKGLDTLIRALPKLPDVVSIMIGIGPMEAAWKALAQELGVADRAIFAGEVSDADLPSHYSAADVFVLPSNSRAEAFGIVNLEAMGHGLPLITTEVGSATSWINQHDITGLVVPPMDPDALAQAVDTLRDPERRRRMGEAARKRVTADFTLEKMVENMARAYQEVLSS
jgi:rhamnosyl/mannosyltransferase